jgi:hypothetical protein
MAPPATLSLVIAEYRQGSYIVILPADLAKRRRQNNVKRIINNIQVHMWASTQLRNCECSHLLTSFGSSEGRMLGSMLDLSHKYRLVRNTKLSTMIGLSKYIQQIGKLSEIQNSGNDQS